ncbi:MAG: VanW family protein [uncultured bacterium]|nr:MAG: VanW family protein [uncultured bacterium]
MKKILRINKKLIYSMAIALAIFFLILISLYVSYFLSYNNKIYPNSTVAGVSVSGRTKEDAKLILEKNVSVPEKIVLNYQDQAFEIKTKDMDLAYDYDASISNVYDFTRTGNVFNYSKNRMALLFSPKNFELIFSINNDKLSKIVSILAGQISIDAVDPSVDKANGKVVVNKGSAGKEVNQEKLTAAIIHALSNNDLSQIQIPVDEIDNTLNDAQATDFALRAEKYLGKSIALKFEYQTHNLTDTDIFKLLDPNGGYKDKELSELMGKAQDSFEREPQNPKFVFENGKVTEFAPSLDGIKVNTDQLKSLLTDKLDQLEKTTDKSLEIDVPVVKTSPEVTTDKVNNLGINELLGRGTSTYYHSIPSRVHNVALATNRINGTLVKPGETFSFNNTLGDVSAFTGYQQAYIISGGKTILGDGGGVCQVSSTLFRAVLNSGFPITERQAHAYRVSYYEQGSPPGLDATVYSPSPDLKFLNDTPGYILIVAKADTKNYSLVFEIYGTSDGRIATISKPIVSNVVPPPEDLYQDDPTLPVGTIKQIDYKAWGSKVTFNYVVTRNGQETINKTFISNYKPWQAVYLRGTGPVQ